MREEKCCGGIVFTRENGEILYVLIRQRNGICGFPKGHMEPGETQQQTALREIREEVHLQPTLLEGFRAEEHYPLPGKNRSKTVTYFLAQYQQQQIVIQPEELTGAMLMPYDSAMQLLEFKEKRDILRKANAFLQAHRF